MGDNWRKDLEWSNRFIPELKRICGEHLIVQADFEEDTQNATDLVVLRSGDIRVACRVRNHEYLERYGDGEFTIRTSRPSGANTELGKIIAGKARYLLYGFASKTELRLASWVLGDLDVFRLWFQQQTARNRGGVPGRAGKNGDGTTFHIFEVSKLPQNFVVCRHRECSAFCCPVCGDQFVIAKWHCHKCASHWSMDMKECLKCHKPRDQSERDKTKCFWTTIPESK